MAGLPVDFSVTELEGKAPYTIELKSPKVEGEGWAWDFGDGATGSGTVGRHTYAKPGDYIATARKGQGTLRQRVLVLPRKAPRTTARPCPRWTPGTCWWCSTNR
ncbi:MAG TPA: PKD domain-containing protein [Phycisphaerae bacterium]|nr:PKD domain-containing protein [Phycisphaerae bacterium]